MSLDEIKIKIKTPNGKLERTITKENKNIEELIKELSIFIKESEEAIKQGQKVYIKCSNCCSGFSIKNCFKLKNKVKTGDNNLSIV